MLKLRDRPWAGQPPAKAEANTKSALLRGHNRLYCLNGQNIHNLISGAPVTGAPSATPTILGPGCHFDGSTTSAITGDAITHSGVWSAWGLVKTNVTSGVRVIMGYGAGSAYSCQLRQNGSNYEVYQHTDEGAPADRAAVDTGGVDTTKVQLIGAQWDGSNLYIYRDGIQRASTAITRMDRAASSYYIGREDSGSTTYYWSGEILLQGFARRTLSAVEWQELYLNPFQVLRPRPRRFFIPSGTTYNESITESVTASESLTTALTAANSISEAVTAADALSTVLTALEAITEAATAGESLATVMTALEVLAESITAADSYVDEVPGGGFSTYNESISEAVTASDALSTVLTAIETITEAAAAGESLATVLTALVSISEAVTAADAVYTFAANPDAIRTLTVRAENRTLAIRAENRTWRI